MRMSRTRQIERRTNTTSSCVMEAVERRVMMSGTVVNDYQMAPGKNAQNTEIVEDAAGNLFTASGAIDAAGGHHALVRQGTRQADGSISWASVPVIDYSLAPRSTLAGPQSSFKDLLIDPASGDLYAAGQALDPAGGTDWVVVKRSAANGAVSVVDDYRYPDGKSAYAVSMAQDASGTIFVGGVASGRWIVRQLKANDPAFLTVQDFVYAGATTNLEGVVAAPTGVYVSGFGSGHWLTQRGVDNGAGGVAWTTVDDFKADPNFSSAAYGAAVDSAGRVYAVGTARKATGPMKRGVIPSVAQWTVRRTTNAGGTWSTIDRFQVSANTSLAHSAESLGTDPAGNLYVVGYGPGADNVHHAVVRTARADGTGWVTIDDWQLVRGKSAFATGFLADRTGALYSVGNAVDGANVRHAIVRRTNPPAGVSTTSSTAPITITTSTQDEPITPVRQQVLA